MAVLKLQESKRTPTITPTAPTTDVDGEPEVTHHPAMSTEMAWVAAVRGELDEYMGVLRTLNSYAPEEVFGRLSAISARLVELRLVTHRSESRRLGSLRTHEIDPMVEQCDRAFRLHSRIQACRTMEWDHMRGLT